ncbi:MAG TPA: DUF4215 domain-containing protein, partial [Polyangiaceae bacterium]|nr:DUF4215 domain-containing protein [Polyangiaceae bacterium]
VSRCGDGYLSADEACDDGDLEDGDGCGGDCERERCGDGLLAMLEECDDGNLEDGDGCDAACRLETDCGDGVAEGVEACDDGNAAREDGCSERCQPELCGDRIVQAGLGETCDDGENLGVYGGCNPDCHLSPWCGDGVVQVESGEACDDGNDEDCDGCDRACRLSECGGPR